MTARTPHSAADAAVCRHREPQPPSPPGAATWVLAVLLLALVAVRTTRALATDAALDHVSGTWLALADDLLRGDLYRPLSSPDGLGGTRFFPLVFALLAGASALVGDLFAAGHALSLASGGLLAFAAWLWMSRLDIPRPTRLLALGVGLSTAAASQALGAIRGDLLPAALGVLGVALVVPRPGTDASRLQGPSVRAVAGAAVCLALAACGKPSALAWTAVAVASLALAGRRWSAGVLAAAVAVLCAAGLGAVEALSDGRFSTSLALGLAGGARPSDWMRAPATFLGVLGDRDPLSIALLAPALVAAATGAAGSWRAPARVALGVWLAATLVLFGSPGVDYNHLLDLQIAAVVLLAVTASRPAPERLARGLLPGLAILCLAWVGLHPSDGLSGRGALRDVAAMRAEVLRSLPPAAAGPVLSEDPAVPIAAGERAWLLDAFMARLARDADPRAVEPLWQRLRGRGFRAVVLSGDPGDADWYDTTHFGPGFARTLAESWALARVVGPYRLFLPRE